MKAVILTFSICLLSIVAAQAQQAIKIGYAYPEYIISLLPEAKQIETELNSYRNKLSAQSDAKYKDLETKFTEFQNKFESLDELTKVEKQQELKELERAFQEFNEQAEASLINKRNELLSPVIEKVQKVISQVAEENEYSHIFNGGSSVDVLLYAKADDNITNLVLEELGITPPE